MSPPAIEALVEAIKKCPVATGKKRPIEGGEHHPTKRGSEPSKKRKKVMATKLRKEVPSQGGAQGRDKYFLAQISDLPRSEAESPLKVRWPNFLASTRVCNDRPLAIEYVRGALYLSMAKQLYGTSFEELTDQTAKLAAWVCDLSPGLSYLHVLLSNLFLFPRQCFHFSIILIDHVHDAGRVAALKDSEQHCRDLKRAVDSTSGELKDLQDSQRSLEDEVLKLVRDAKVL
ncbi:hypothetical protein BHM03_00040917 [Ensete ventricosum]|nr:hypothetical protein BHM03_00040917 [Ensete ventricosum]